MGSRFILAVACAAALLAAPGVARAATFTVGAAGDGGSGSGVCATSADACTLRTAILKANATAGADTVLLPAGAFALTKAGAGEDASATGDLDVVESLTIAGAGSAATVVDGGALDRILDVLDPGAELVLSGLALRNGNLPGGAAAIRALGPALRLSDVVVSGITGASAIDVGSAGAATLSLTDSRLAGNLTTLKLVDLHPNGPATLSLTRSVVEGNTVTAATGSEGLVDVAPTGPPTATPTSVAIIDSSFARNALGNEGAGALQIAPSAGGVSATVTRARFEANVAGSAGAGRGGAIAFAPTGGGAQSLTIADSSFVANVAGAAGSGAGGAIDFAGGPGAGLTVTGSTFALNRAGPAGGTQGARGGAIAAGAGTVVAISNSTFSENAAAAPASSLDGGGALWFSGASAALTNVTLVANSVGPQGRGAGLRRAVLAGTLTVRNSILAANSAGGGPGDCDGGIVSAGHNLEGATTCGFLGEFQTTDPLLAPLADNGGPTATRMPDGASRAIDAGDPAACPPTDQRGVARPQGAACDIGAVEAPAVVAAASTVPPVEKPGPKPAPEPRPRISARDVIVLPSTKRCVSHKRFVVRLRRPAGMRLTTVRVFLNGARVRLLRGKSIKSSITLKRLPQGRFEIRVTVLTGTSSVASLTRTQRYRTCARKLRRR